MLKENETSVEYLEKKYAHRGLKIDGCFWKSCPTQAFGVIDGMIFYFRFRHDYAALEIGYPFEVPDVFGDSMPHYVKFIAGKDNVTGEEHAGELTPEGEVEIFSYLVENLEEYIETEEEIEERLRYEVIMREDAENKKNGILSPGDEALAEWELELLNGSSKNQSKNK